VGAASLARNGQVCWRMALVFAAPAAVASLPAALANEAVSAMALILAFVPIMLLAAGATWQRAGAGDAEVERPDRRRGAGQSHGRRGHPRRGDHGNAGRRHHRGGLPGDARRRTPPPAHAGPGFALLTAGVAVLLLVDTLVLGGPPA